MTAIEDLWAQVPDAHCRGLCQDSCANIAASLTERERIWQATGVALPDPFEGGRHQTGTCPLLVDGRCSVREIRPLICRMYGSVQGMPCPHGCAPTFGLMPDTAARELLAQSFEVTE